MSERYDKMLADLHSTGKCSAVCFGQSMKPLIESGSRLEFEVAAPYISGDAVFCRVNGRWIDAHLVLSTQSDGTLTKYLIGNNQGHENGWTFLVFARVVKATAPSGKVREFSRLPVVTVTEPRAAE